MAVGSMIITFVGERDSKQFDLSGSAIDEVGQAEKHANPSDVILTLLAWENCDQDVFKVDRIEDAPLYRVTTLSSISCLFVHVIMISNKKRTGMNTVATT